MFKNLSKLPKTRKLQFVQGKASQNSDDDQDFQTHQQQEEGLLDSESDFEEEMEKVHNKRYHPYQNDQEYDTLQDLIFHLNQEDNSEDEGIEDYIIGGYHPCHIGEVLSNRYVLIQKLGYGHFSTVWLAKDFKHGNYVAVKIMKSSPQYLDNSLEEVEILQKVAQKAYDPEWIKSLKMYEPHKMTFDRDDSHVLNMLNCFLYKGPYGNHFCMVFEILGVNLLKVLQRYDFKGLPLNLVKEITRQVLMVLDFLNRVCRVIHTDLKPENVLLCLTPEEMKNIVENGQLSNRQLYRDRLRLYRKKYHLGPENQSESENDEEKMQLSVPTQMKIKQIQEKLKDEKLNKNQRKNLRRKLNKYQEKGAEEIQELKQQIGSVKQQKKPKTTKELFSAFNKKLVLDKGPKLQEGFKVKIADMGNATWQHHLNATEIQTRNYRAPEILTGSRYNLSADMWSLACMTFELLTGELLFLPRKDEENEMYGKNDDHLAQMMKLLGRFPKKFSLRGAKSKKYFYKDGTLQRIRKNESWTIKDDLIAKYKFTEEQASEFENFMSHMLQCIPQKRLLANEMLKHPWLYKKSDNYHMDQQTYEKVMKEKYSYQPQKKEEVVQYESENEDALGEDNSLTTKDDQNEDDEFFGYEKVGDIRYIDRDFNDLGYIGYGDGIFLQKLDAGPNRQFS